MFSFPFSNQLRFLSCSSSTMARNYEVSNALAVICLGPCTINPIMLISGLGCHLGAEFTAEQLRRHSAGE